MIAILQYLTGVFLGVFKNTEPLDYAHNHNYILEVTAEDCGKEESLRSEKILISVKVREGCKPGWKGT